MLSKWETTPPTINEITLESQDFINRESIIILPCCEESLLVEGTDDRESRDGWGNVLGDGGLEGVVQTFQLSHSSVEEDVDEEEESCVVDGKTVSEMKMISGKGI